MSDTLTPPAAEPDAPAVRRPPAPVPHERALHPLEVLYGLWSNPLTTWTRRSFEEPLVLIGSGVMGPLAIVSDPAAIRHVMVENAANYRKDDLQLRVLRPGLGNGLLTAEGDEWRLQRRALAPLFTPRVVAGFFPAMQASADWLVARWRPLRPGRRIDLASEMSQVTLDVLSRTIFPQGLGRDPRISPAPCRPISRPSAGCIPSTSSVRPNGCRAWVARRRNNPCVSSNPRSKT